MDAYECGWRRVARSQSWDELTALHSWLQFKFEVTKDERKRRALREAKQRKREAAQVYAVSLCPVGEWVGACWLSPSGEVYPVLWGMHTERARDIFKRAYAAESRERARKHLKRLGEAALCKRGWLRVSDDGVATDQQWRWRKHSSQAQLSALWAMYERGRERRGVTAFVGYQLDEFLKGLSRSLDYCVGLVDKNGKPILEAAIRAEELLCTAS